MNTNLEHNAVAVAGPANSAAATPAAVPSAASAPPEAPNLELHPGVTGAKAGGDWDTREMLQALDRIQAGLLQLMVKVEVIHSLLFLINSTNPAATGEPPHEPSTSPGDRL